MTTMTLKYFILAAGTGAALSFSAVQAGVTIYGVIDASVSFSDFDIRYYVSEGFIDSDSSKEWSVDSIKSYIGFRGNEDLGNGLSAIWQVENAIDVSGSGGFFGNGWASRNSFVG